MEFNVYAALIKALVERHSNELHKIYEEHKKKIEAIGREAFDASGLKELGFHLGCVGSDGYLVLWKHDEKLEDYEAIFDDLKTEPFDGGTDDNTIVRGTYKGFPVEAFVKVEGGENNEA